MSTVEWDSQSSLLLVQLIYKYGDPYDPSSTPASTTAPVFEQIAHQLTNHTLIRPSKRKFTAAICEQHYIDLLANESLTRELSLPTSVAANKKPSQAVATLAQRLYIAHITFLKSEIQALEAEFLSTHKEIEAIDRGEWDPQFQKQLDQTATTKVETPKEENVEIPVSAGVKRTRGGRRKDNTPTPTTPVEEDGIVDDSPAAKRSRKGTETDDVAEPPPEPVDEEMNIEQPVEKLKSPEAEAEPPSEKEEIIKLDAEETEEEPEAPEAPEVPEVPEEPEEPEVPEVPEEPEVPEVPEEPEEPEEPEAPEEPEEPGSKPTETTIPTTAKPESLSPESDGPLLTYFANMAAETTPTRPTKQKPFSTLIHNLHASLSSLRSATLFSQPIREQDAPGYSSLVLKPADLKTLWKQVKDGTVTDSVVFHREVARMFANAIVYNAENSPVGQMSRDMATEGLQLCEGYRRSENFGNGGGRVRKRKGN